MDLMFTECRSVNSILSSSMIISKRTVYMALNCSGQVSNMINLFFFLQHLILTKHVTKSIRGFIDVLYRRVIKLSEPNVFIRKKVSPEGKIILTASSHFAWCQAFNETPEYQL